MPPWTRRRARLGHAVAAPLGITGPYKTLRISRLRLRIRSTPTSAPATRITQTRRAEQQQAKQLDSCFLIDPSPSFGFLLPCPPQLRSNRRAMAADLIPGLPEEVARECLVRVGFDQLPLVRRISRQWKAEVESPDYHRLRRAEFLARPVLALVQAQPAPDAAVPDKRSSAVVFGGGPATCYRMVLMDPVEGRWATLPGLPRSLPLFCQVAAVDGGQGRKRLAVVGGWDPDTWAPMDAVFVYDFLTGAWRRGAPMPGPRRSFFACAAVGGAVYVAGGHDEEKNALRSALAYDPEADAWTQLPDMAAERDEPRGLRVGGRFLVVGGYPTEAQGQFTGSAEAFDPETSTWAPVQEGLLEDGACPRTCCAAPAGTEPIMYMLRDGHLVARHGGAPWRPVAQVPEDARTAGTVSAIPDGRVVVIGSGCHGGDQTVYVLSPGKKGACWARAPAPPEFSGHVQASCFLEI